MGNSLMHHLLQGFNMMALQLLCTRNLRLILAVALAIMVIRIFSFAYTHQTSPQANPVRTMLQTEHSLYTPYLDWHQRAGNPQHSITNAVHSCSKSADKTMKKPFRNECLQNPKRIFT
jgi:hypothetical protein